MIIAHSRYSDVLIYINIRSIDYLYYIGVRYEYEQSEESYFINQKDKTIAN